MNKITKEQKQEIIDFVVAFKDSWADFEDLLSRTLYVEEDTSLEYDEDRDQSDHEDNVRGRNE